MDTEKIDTKSINSVSEFIKWVDGLPGSIIYYRGLSDACWTLEASGYRRMKISSEDNVSLDPEDFQDHIKRLMEDAKSHGFGQRDGNKIFDLELLAELQHNGAATCLIDFTGNPLIALWFACRGNPKKDGRVFAMRTDHGSNFSEVGYDVLHNSIDTFFSEGKLWTWVPKHDSSRIIAQSSVFIFGKGQIEEQYYEAINIDKKAKMDICDELQEKYNINELNLFRDFTGFALANAHDKPRRDYSEKNYYRQGTLFHQRGKHQEAIEQYDKAIEINPKDAAAYYARGLSKKAVGDHDGAIADYAKAIEIDPKWSNKNVI